VTLDDITQLVAAQRTSAWADVARRIAHEIKNPLTPIQLSAERIKRKYGKVILEDKEVFDKCTETIIRQVGDIRCMVDEFSSFARMPKAVLALDDVREVVKEMSFLQKVGLPGIEFEVILPETPVKAAIDRRLIGQCVTNIIKNAGEAIEPMLAADPDYKGRIEVSLSVENGLIRIDICDNGIGLPSENRNRLTEPYMTTREKGTGLGLAIVSKIMEEHQGRLVLMDAPGVASGGTGALVRLELPLLNDTKD
jgi:two-component system nitrogen regulation sensor histidine kinase NtrY